MAAELGLVATVGVGSAATRVINLSHWVALRALVPLASEAGVVLAARGSSDR
jgi:hypothetical protein